MTELLERIEALAAALAAEAGAFATEQLEREVLVEYKADATGKENTNDPVSEVDRAVEQLLRDRVAAEFPDHVVVGEEDATQPAPDTEFVWVLDPVDGTANFVNGFPLFAVSIGVLQHGRPVVGAV
ncbi:MAG: inositol-1-monophosphatase, partial [Dehalococcoidia bacterium]|nr:inositol-1-monophosphatase [Dehalococcoidia bacterium]